MGRNKIDDPLAEGVIAKNTKVTNILELISGPSLQFEYDGNVFIHEGWNHIYLRSNSSSATCPNCKLISAHKHGVIERNPQWLPLDGRPTRAHIKVNRYKCKNSECRLATFEEKIEGLSDSQQRSDELTVLIFSIALFCSARATAEICGYMGIVTCHDSVKNLIDRIEIIDVPDVEVAGIDDIATRKGMDYATVVYNLEDGTMLALLPDRDGKELRKWLIDHPQIKIVARDRAGAYAKAITEVLPMCIQVADRFHMFQNLMGYLKEIFKHNVPSVIYIDVSQTESEGKNIKILDEEPPKIKVPIVEIDNNPLLESLSYDNSPPVDDQGKTIIYDDKCHNYRNTDYQERQEAKNEKYKKILTAKKLVTDNPNMTKKEIASKLGITVPTLKRYIAMNEEDLEKVKIVGSSYKKRDVPINGYLNIIYKMLRDGHSPSVVYSYIYHAGYKGSSDALRNRVENISANNFGKTIGRGKFTKEEYPEWIIAIKSNEIIKYITQKDKSKMEGTNTAKFYHLLKERFCALKLTEEIWIDFYDVLMAKDVSKLDDFIKKYEASKISSFVNGLKNDLDAVKYAITSDVSSGKVEGSNNKVKVIKRVCFGRAGLNHLRKKCYGQFRVTNTDTLPYELIEHSFNKKRN